MLDMLGKHLEASYEISAIKKEDPYDFRNGYSQMDVERKSSFNILTLDDQH